MRRMKRFGSHTLGPNGERLDGRKMASIDLDLRYTPLQSSHGVLIEVI